MLIKHGQTDRQTEFQTKRISDRKNIGHKEYLTEEYRTERISDRKNIGQKEYRTE